MKVLCFSSFTFSYLNRARVLFESLRKHQPDWQLVALITDSPPPEFQFEPAGEPFDSVVYAEDLGIGAFRSWVFKHDLIEACTAVKGPFAYKAVRDGVAEAVVYLDPDTCAFDSLDPIEYFLESSDIILTPHSLDPDRERQAIIDNEICSLKTGIYNLGFCAFRTAGEGARFAKWWSERLLDFCYDDIPNGLFVDQRWCDHVPALFERVKILRDPGYNVASWNLSNRRVSISAAGQILVNGFPLRFWHFTKLGAVGDAMTKRYAEDNFEVYEVWSWYRRRIARSTESSIPAGYWAYDAYDDGTRIKKEHRVLYRSNPNLAKEFSDPFASGPGTYLEWLRTEGLVPDSVAPVCFSHAAPGCRSGEERSQAKAHPIDQRALDRIEGWVSPTAQALTVLLMRVQRERGWVTGVLELGVYRGKYLSVLACGVHGLNAPVVGVDAFLENPDKELSAKHREFSMRFIHDAISSVTGEPSRAVLVASRTADLEPETLMGIAPHGFSFISVDAGHEKPNLVVDMGIACDLLSDDGIVAVDDVFSPTTPGVGEGFFEYFHREPDANLVPFATGGNKVFMCRRARHAFYLQAVRSMALLAEPSIPGVTMAAASVLENERMNWSPRLIDSEIVPFP